MMLDLITGLLAAFHATEVWYVLEAMPRAYG